MCIRDRLYGCILGIYVIIAGPGMYLFFRRRKKRGYLWIAVPILSVAFSAIIYIVGTSTRIQRPYINYLSQIVLGNDKNAKAKDMSTLFSVTSISNNPFSISLRGCLLYTSVFLVCLQCFHLPFQVHKSIQRRHKCCLLYTSRCV